MVVAADLRGVGVDVHQPLRWSGNAEQRIALRRRLRHPPANQKNEIGRFDARFQLGIDREADFAGEIVVLAVEGARAAKGTGHGQVEAFGEPGEGGARSAWSIRRRREWRSAAPPPTASSAIRPFA